MLLQARAQPLLAVQLAAKSLQGTMESGFELGGAKIVMCQRSFIHRQRSFQTYKGHFKHIKNYTTYNNHIKSLSLLLLFLLYSHTHSDTSPHSHHTQPTLNSFHCSKCQQNNLNISIKFTMFLSNRSTYLWTVSCFL